MPRPSRGVRRQLHTREIIISRNPGSIHHITSTLQLFAKTKSHGASSAGSKSLPLSQQLLLAMDGITQTLNSFHSGPCMFQTLFVMVQLPMLDL